MKVGGLEALDIRWIAPISAVSRYPDLLCSNDEQTKSAEHPSLRAPSRNLPTSRPSSDYPSYSSVPYPVRPNTDPRVPGLPESDYRNWRSSTDGNSLSAALDRGKENSTGNSPDWRWSIVSGSGSMVLGVLGLGKKGTVAGSSGRWPSGILDENTSKTEVEVTGWWIPRKNLLMSLVLDPNRCMKTRNGGPRVLDPGRNNPTPRLKLI